MPVITKREFSKQEVLVTDITSREDRVDFLLLSYVAVADRRFRVGQRVQVRYTKPVLCISSERSAIAAHCVSTQVDIGREIFPELVIVRSNHFKVLLFEIGFTSTVVRVYTSLGSAELEVRRRLLLKVCGNRILPVSSSYAEVIVEFESKTNVTVQTLADIKIGSLIKISIEVIP